MSENAFNKLQIIAGFEDKLYNKTGTSTKLDEWAADKSLLEDEDAVSKKLEELAESFKKARQKVQDAQNPLQEKLNLLYEKAALSGRFDPSELEATITDKTEAQQLLSLLSKDVYVEATGKVQWLMNQSKRKEILTQLYTTGKLSTALAQPLPSTDETGMLLRRVIQEGEFMNASVLSDREKIAGLAALEMLEGIDLPKPGRESISSLIHEGFIIETYPYNEATFTGREAQLAQLEHFLRANNPVSGSWTGLVIYGLGGVGKSTLLAKFIHDVIRNQAATTVILDFDRPGVDPNDSSWLEREISRQTGRQYPAFADTLSQLRKSLRSYEENFRSEYESFYQSHEGKRQNKQLIAEIRNLLMNNTGQQVPFLLVLDTVEEAAQRNLMGVLHEWLMYLKDLLYPIELKVIFSGRLFNDHLQQVLQIQEVKEQIELTAFDEASAAAFLQKKGLSEPDAYKIIESGCIPLRPLELKLLAELVLKEPVQLDDLLKELSGDNSRDSQQLQEGMFNGLIYRRVLMRISDPKIRKLAYPGLILRYLTPQIILDILSPVLQLDIQDIDEAGRILNNLANYSWLCTIEKNGEVWHRRDMRLSMLQTMTAREPELVAKIRKAALEYFERAGDEKGMKAEYYYHLLMQVTTREDLENIEYKTGIYMVAAELIRDIADLPKPAAALVKFLSDITLKDDEILQLPAAEFLQIYSISFRQMVSGRRFLGAYQLYQRHRELTANTKKPAAPQSNAEQDMLFCLAEWDQITDPVQQKKVPNPGEALSLLSGYLFPYYFINTERWIDSYVYGLVEKLVENRSKGVLNEDAGGDLFRISHALVMLGGVTGIRRDTVKLLKQLVSLMDKTKLSPQGDRSRLLLYLLCYDEWPDFYQVSTSLIQLNTKWLEALISMDMPEASPLPGRIRDFLVDVNQQKNYSSKQLLSTIDSMQIRSDNNKRISVQLSRWHKKDLSYMVAGPDLLFRDPCRYAILDAATTIDDYRQLAEMIRKCIPFTLTDLEPEAFAATVSGNREFALEPFIEIVDRCWNLGSLLIFLNRAYPENKKINVVNELYMKWRRTFETLAPS